MAKIGSSTPGFEKATVDQVNENPGDGRMSVWETSSVRFWIVLEIGATLRLTRRKRFVCDRKVRSRMHGDHVLS